MKNSSTLLFRLVVDKKDKGKLVGGWDNPTGDGLVFSCSVKELNRRGRKLRKKAREWAAEFEDEDSTEPERWCELHQYAAECFEYLFRDVWEEVSRALTEEKGDVAIKVLLFTPSVIFPWGLLCNPADVPTTGMSKNRPPALWGSKYNLTVAQQYVNSSIAEHQSDWSFIPIVCQTTFAQQTRVLANDERKLADLIQTRRVDPVATDVQLDSSSQCFFYIYSHGGNGQIELVSNQGVRRSHSPLDIVSRWVKPGGRAVAVMNACDTVKSTRNMGETLMLASYPREVASISTEFEIQDHFAMRFGLELVDRCVQLGESTVDAMKIMRKRHYPMSIVYSLYCLKAFALKQPLSLLDSENSHNYREAIKNVNFSDLTHGSE